MKVFKRQASAISQVRTAAKLTQQELAERAGTVQSVVARMERGQGNPTVETLERLFAAAGFALQIRAVPIETPDPVVEAYKGGIDRTLLRENLRRSVDERLIMNDEVQQLARELRQHK